MHGRKLIGTIAVIAALSITSPGAQAFDESKYPDFVGQWRRPPGVGNQWDTSRPPRRGQPPLTAASLARACAGLFLHGAASLANPSAQGGIHA